MMVNTRIMGALCLLVLVGTAGAATYHWQGGVGNWSDNNWTDETTSNVGAPSAADEAYIGRHLTTGEDSDVTLDGNYTVTEGARAGLMIGDRHSAKLTIGAGTSLTVNGLATLNSRTSEATTRILNVSGGALTIQSGGDFVMTSTHADDVATTTVSAGTMSVQGDTDIGFNGTGGDPGNTTFTVAGGSFSVDGTFNVYDSTVSFSGGTATLGASSFSSYVSLYGDSTLSVTGDDATISLSSYLYFRDGSDANVEFTFDESGVSTVDGASRVYIYDGSNPTFTVNADALVGASVGDEFVLLNYGLWRLDNVTQSGSMADYITFVNAGSSITGELVGDTDANTVSFRVTGVPEPATLALLGMGGLALLRRRRA